MAAISMMAYPTRPAFPNYHPSYNSHSSRSPPSPFSPTFSHHPRAPLSTSASSLERYQISSAQSSPVSRPSTSESETRPSLPSISNLLGIADRSRESSYRRKFERHIIEMTHLLTTSEVPQQPSITSHPAYTSRPSDNTNRADGLDDRTPRSTNSVFDRSVILNANLPPSPPRSDAGYAPTAKSVAPVVLPSRTQSFPVATAEPRPTALTQSNSTSPRGYRPSPSSSPRYTTSPKTGPSTSLFPSSSPYQEPLNQMATTSLYAQRPLPTNFPPAPTASHVVTPPPNLAAPTHNPWEHHHYISPSSQASFPQTQDRYICPACNKAFSRPSSLKIHSHSHTGEKPFKCPHTGCNKAFSVRSNMKRHERGCHAALAAGLVTETIAHVR